MYLNDSFNLEIPESSYKITLTLHNNTTGRNAMKLKKYVSTFTAMTALGCILAGTPAIADGHKTGGEKFKQTDTNGDGMLSKAEMKVQQEKRLDKMFSKADVNNDGNLTKDELHAHREKRKERKAKKE
jgi:hypothetical protein